MDTHKQELSPSDMEVEKAAGQHDAHIQNNPAMTRIILLKIDFRSVCSENSQVPF